MARTRPFFLALALTACAAPPEAAPPAPPAEPAPRAAYTAERPCNCSYGPPVPCPGWVVVRHDVGIDWGHTGVESLLKFYDEETPPSERRRP